LRIKKIIVYKISRSDRNSKEGSSKEEEEEFQSYRDLSRDQEKYVAVIWRYDGHEISKGGIES
jgi:hypothetical protein